MKKKSSRTLAIALATFAAASSFPATAAAEAAGFSAELGFSGSYALSGYSDGTYAEASEDVESWAAPLSCSPWLAAELGAKYFRVSGRLSANTDGKYDAALAGSGKLPLGTYYSIDQGGIESEIWKLKLRAGRFPHYDLVDTPYSLFVNGRGLSAQIADLSYEDDRFFYESRWIGLNYGSDEKTAAWPSGFPTRGANLKAYGARIGGMRFGIEEAAVYCGSYFDADYFLSPVPMYFSQYFRGTDGRPWTEARNDNDIVGAFWDWKRDDGWTFLAQVLVDDFNVHWLLPSTPDFPWQAAFSLGARKATRIGSFGVYVAGATEYTFEGNEMTSANQSENAYSYTYYPDTRFDHDWLDESVGQYAPISIEDNMLGYQYGENNVALRLDWAGRASGLDLGAYFEFRLMGSNSPANTWHDGTTDPQDGTHWFDDPVLEKRFLLDLGASTLVGAWRFTGELVGGVAIDALRLREPVGTWTSVTSLADQNVYIYEPVKGQIDPIFRVKLAASYRFATAK